jgi:hypothetical protein
MNFTFRPKLFLPLLIRTNGSMGSENFVGPV